VKIQGLEHLMHLEQLFLADNHISRLEGLTNNRKVHLVNISNQKTKKEMTFEEETCMALAYSLEVLHCDNNRVRDISSNFSLT
jgi:Leucine-rich repeat (LRR) protein